MQEYSPEKRKALEALLQRVENNFKTHVEGSILRRGNNPATQPPGIKQIEITYSDALSFNASVSRNKEGFAKYSFNKGIIWAIGDVAMQLSCTPAFCAAIPLAPEEIISIHQENNALRYIDYYYLQQEGQIVIHPFNQITDNSARQHIGNMIMGFCTRFLSMHEQSHYYLGHLHYLMSESNTSSWNEIPDGTSRKIPAEISQALELQADGLATEMLLTLPDKQKMEELENPLITRRQDWVFYAFISIAIVNCLLEKADHFSFSQGNENTHPPARVRNMVLFEKLQTFVRKEIDTVDERIIFLENLFQELFVVYQTLNCEGLDIDAFNEYFEPSVTDCVTDTAREFINLKEVLSKLYPELKPFEEIAMRSIR